MMMQPLIQSFEKNVTHVTYAVETSHFHTGYEFIFVTEGTVTMKVDDKICTLTAPGILLLNPFEAHKLLSSSENYKRHVLVLHAEALEQNTAPRLIAALKCRPKGYQSILQPDAQMFERLLELLEQIGAEMQTEQIFHNEFLYNAIHNLLILLFRLQPDVLPINKSMLEVQTYIDTQYADIENLQELCQHFFVSPSHFSRAFKEYSGYSPSQYLLNTRLHHAKELLLNTDLQVGEISRAIGFRDTNNFIRQFRHKEGVSPNTFRVKS